MFDGYVKNFTNFSCGRRALLLNNALNFAVEMTIFSLVAFVNFFKQ